MYFGGCMNDKKALAMAVKATNDQATAKLTWIRHPLLERIATAFARYVGMESIDADGNPLLVTALKHALRDIREHEENDDAARAAFVNALLHYSTDVFAQLAVVEQPSGGVQWMPFAGGLLEFMSGHNGAPVTVTRKPTTVAPDMARVFMIMKILPSSMFDEQSLNAFLKPSTTV
jgi:hypothetical protein